MTVHINPIQQTEIINGRMVFINLCPVCLQALKVETACKYCGWCKDAKRK